MWERKTKDEFIRDARLIHNNKYDYSLVEIKGNNKTKVKIRCNACGTVFEQRVNNHLNGQGCPECAKKQRVKERVITKEEFIERAIAKHGYKYDYSLVNSIKNRKGKVKIICKKCRTVFEQSIDSHLSGSGCPYCAKVQRVKSKTDTKEEFVIKARKKHGDKYDYSKVNYINNETKVCVICPEHGDFWIEPGSHKRGRGCPSCAGNKRLTIKEFINRARNTHGEKYDYSLVSNIKNNKTKVKIRCNTCETVFEQKINVHLNGSGCPLCNKSHLEDQTMVFLEKGSIRYEPQKKFPWLKNKREMPLDFYLPEYNVAIECQGIQHYEARGDIFTEEKVNAIKKRDIMKFQLCKEHGIPIYYIRYDENVEESINRLLSGIKT